MDTISYAAQLVESCVAGHPFAWQRLIDEYAPVVVQAIEQLGSATDTAHRRADVDRLTRAVFESLRNDDFAALRAFDHRASLETFLVIVTRRVLHASGEYG